MTEPSDASMHDVIVAGAGPVGLAFVRSLARTGLRLAVVDQQCPDALLSPRYDGREIALTQASIRILRDLDVWHVLPWDAVATLRAARVLDGRSGPSLDLGPRHDRNGLGSLVSNHHLKRALFRAVADQPQVDWILGRRVEAVDLSTERAGVTLSDGTGLFARLLVVADSRLSATRERCGISADVNELGRSMLVVRVAHELDHEETAVEWFFHGHTLAMLPLRHGEPSFVLTLDGRDASRLAGLSPGQLVAELEMRSELRLGRLSVRSEPFVYPLVTTFARRFVGRRCALLGDAAVGMHPVTAHGFNFGLRGQAELARLVISAASRGADIAAPETLAPYERRHRRACRPLYEATNLIAGLYSDDRPAARLARKAALAAARLGPGRRALSSLLA